MLRPAVAGTAIIAGLVPAAGALGELSALGGGRAAQVGGEAVENSCVPALKLTSGWCGDGGSAREALLEYPASVTVLDDGSLAFTDSYIAAVRRVRPDGVIERLAGTGQPGYGGDGGPARQARIEAGASLAALPGGGFLLAERAQHRVRRVSPDGTITTVAGTGRAGFAGDGGPATRARLSTPQAVSALPGGGFLIVDSGNDRVRRVDGTGVISTVAGTGARGFGGDGGPAPAARLNSPTDITALPDGGFVFVDGAAAHRLRKVTSTGTIETLSTQRDRRLMSVASSPEGALVVVAESAVQRVGVGGQLTLAARQPCPAAPPWVRVDPGDDRPASRARLAAADVAVASDGSLVVADWMFARIRRIDPAGVITTIAGGGGVPGRVHMRDQPCGGASPEYPVWNYFGIVRADGGRSRATVRFGTTLDARVTLTVLRGNRTVAKRRRSVVADTHTLRLRLRPGRYRLVLQGRHADLAASDRSAVRVR